MSLRTLLKKFRQEQEGGALVEACLTLPVLFLMVLGAGEFTRVVYTSLEVVSAARAGVSYGAETGGTSSDSTGITYAAQHDAANLSGLTVNSSSAYACSDGTASTGLNTDCPSSHIEQTLTVTTSISLNPLIHVPGMPQTYTINGSASQLCLQ